MINKVTLVGHVGKDPEVRHLESGQVVARFSVATNENYKDKEGNWQKMTEWHTVTCWGEKAKSAESYMRKGRLVYIEGRLKTRKYTDSNGVEKYATEVEAQTLKYLDKVDTASETSNTSGGMMVNEPSGGGDSPMPDDDLPF